ncbi:hypothetical protein [uncultured Fibrella sp.]|uniref:hypothetical protein n=1 Tax=uncultured Fibrella sp. TaxID=1284596 RepID=UPI0035C9F400
MRRVANKTGLFSFLIFLLFSGSLIVSLLAKQPLLWMDEILSYLLISDQSLAHLNEAIVSGLDANPPLFANLYWLIAHVVSMNVVFLKGISVVIFAATLAFFHYYTSRILGGPIRNFVLITSLAAFTYLNSTLATQIRAYPLFLLLTLGYFVVLHQLTRQPTKPTWLLAHVGLGLLVVLTHNFGLFYVAAAGAFFCLLWLWSRNRAYAYVLGTFPIIGLVWLVVWYTSFAIQAKAGEPHSWIPLPTVHSFFQIVGELAPALSARLEAAGSVPVLPALRFAGLVILFFAIAVPSLKEGFRAAVSDSGFMLYLLAAFIYLATISITLIVSLVHTSVFISRYLWPNHLLVIYQLVYAYHFFTSRERTWPRLAHAFPANYAFRRFKFAGSRLIPLLPVYVAGLACLLFYQGRKVALAPTTVMMYVDQLDKRYPVFLESSINFMPVWFYSHTHRPVYFLLDYKSAFDPANDPGASVGFHTLAAVKAKYHVGAVRPLASFNAQTVPHFFVVDERWNYQIERFIQNKSIQIIRTIPTTMPGISIRECVFADASFSPEKPENCHHLALVSK